MLQTCKDAAAVAVSHNDAMAAYGGEGKLEVEYLPAVEVINNRGTYSASMGVLAPWMRPIAKKFPWFSKGDKAVKALAGIAIAAVAQRLQTPTDRRDLLGKLQDGKDDEGKPMGREEREAIQ